MITTQKINKNFYISLLEKVGRLTQEFRNSNMQVAEFLDRVSKINKELDPYTDNISGPKELEEILSQSFGLSKVSEIMNHERQHAAIEEKYDLTYKWGYLVLENITLFEEKLYGSHPRIIPFVDIDEESLTKMKTWNRDKMLRYQEEQFKDIKVRSDGDQMCYG